MADPLVDTVRDGHVLVIRMRREEKRNAINRALAFAIDEALNTLDDDPDLWVGVLTGTSKVFSAGSDIAAREDYNTPRGGEYGLIRRERRKPLIAAVEGPALGGGLEIVLACDLVVAAETAVFGLPEVRRGLVPTSAGLFRASRGFPLNLARELILVGDPISAPRAHAAGFVNQLVEAGAAEASAVALAARMCLNGPVAVQACLAAINGQLAQGDDAGWAATKVAMDAILTSEDMQEGVQAFFERRPPQWKGR
ncbi:MAG: enoyl-CoA hydratase-related protein [Actinomycetota bacterium]|nr:enoyl-CoA hydratase-related protein [Actinomycetota bacterium]